MYKTVSETDGAKVGVQPAPSADGRIHSTSRRVHAGVRWFGQMEEFETAHNHSVTGAISLA